MDFIDPDRGDPAAWDCYLNLVRTFSHEQRVLWLRSQGVPDAAVPAHLEELERSSGARPRLTLLTGQDQLSEPGGDNCGGGPSLLGTEWTGLEAWRAWRTWLRAQSSPETVRVYTALLLRFLAETGCEEPADYTEQDCTEFLASFAPRGWAKHEYAKALRSFFRWAVRNVPLAVDPMEFVQVKKPRRVPPVTLTEDELIRLLVAAVFTLGERQAWALLLMYSLGVRRVEAAGLKWDHIREGESGPVIEIRETKGANERDPLPLSPLALECLAHLRELPPRPQCRRGPDYIVRGGLGAISEWVHRAGMAAGLPQRKIGAHRLRASVATWLLKSGVDVTVVQRILGHLQLETTAAYLAQADELEMRAALARTWRPR